MITKEEAKELLAKRREGTSTAEEDAMMEAWYLQFGQEEIDLPYDRIEGIKEEIYRNLPTYKKIKIVYWPIRIATIAASVIFIWGIWTILFVSEPKANNSIDINPGGNKAILTLSNGTQINLNDAKAGTLIAQAGLEIIKDKDGQISYKVTGSSSAKNEYNTITTPRGGQYTVTLPDGSKIWLNAASTLKYPTAFESIRKVSLSGEAYFEVAKDKKHPFMVTTDQQEVEVLGTHFNVSAYKNELITRTTLLEGSVRVSLPNVTSLRGGTTKQSQQRYIVLKPNEESSLTKNNIQIKRVDPDEAVAWKNGKFLFRNQSLEQIMNKLSRWYDVEVIYEDKALAGQLFGGIIARSEKISRVLQTLEETGEVHFKIEGRQVTVMK